MLGGNWINKENSGQNALGNELVNINPFIYKGYIYDEETDFYYLKSRYYSPKIRRFINVDSEIGERNNLEHFNLFCYCINNPVNLADEEGNWPRWFKWVVVGVLVVAAVAAAAVTAGAALGAASVLVAGMSFTVLATAGSAITIAGTTIATSAVVKAGVLLAMSYVSYELARYSINSINEIINSDYDSFGIMETSRER